MCPSLRPLLSGLPRVDSLTLDPHKGLFLPYGNGALLVKDGAALRAAHEGHAGYLPPLPDDDFLSRPRLSPDSRTRCGYTLRMANSFRSSEHGGRRCVFNLRFAARAIDLLRSMGESSPARIRADHGAHRSRCVFRCACGLAFRALGKSAVRVRRRAVQYFDHVGRSLRRRVPPDGLATTADSKRVKTVESSSLARTERPDTESNCISIEYVHTRSWRRTKWIGMRR